MPSRRKETKVKPKKTTPKKAVGKSGSIAGKGADSARPKAAGKASAKKSNKTGDRDASSKRVPKSAKSNSQAQTSAKRIPAKAAKAGTREGGASQASSEKTAKTVAGPKATSTVKAKGAGSPAASKEKVQIQTRAKTRRPRTGEKALTPSTSAGDTPRSALTTYQSGTAALYDSVFGQEKPPAPQAKLTKDDLAKFRQLLLQKRSELVGNVNNLSNEALQRNRQDSTGDLSSMPIHMADIGSDNWEQEFTLGLLENERTLLREIDEALDRLTHGTYGICVATGRPITKARLRAKPWAKYCIEYARMKELGRVR